MWHLRLKILKNNVRHSGFPIVLVAYRRRYNRSGLIVGELRLADRLIANDRASTIRTRRVIRNTFASVSD